MMFAIDAARLLLNYCHIGTVQDLLKFAKVLHTALHGSFCPFNLEQSFAVLPVRNKVRCRRPQNSLLTSHRSGASPLRSCRAVCTPRCAAWTSLGHAYISLKWVEMCGAMHSVV